MKMLQMASQSSKGRRRKENTPGLAERLRPLIPDLFSLEKGELVYVYESEIIRTGIVFQRKTNKYVGIVLEPAEFGFFTAKVHYNGKTEDLPPSHLRKLDKDIDKDRSSCYN